MPNNSLLDKVANLWECGMEMSQQLNSELKHTHWELEDISNQVRGLNQVSIELSELEDKLTSNKGVLL